MNLDQKLYEFFLRCPDHRSVTSDKDRIELQQMHNMWFENNKEHNRNCSGCRARMWNAMKQVMEELPPYDPNN